MPQLVIENVHKVYPNGVKVLKNVSLDAEKGDFLVLVGPSGCGKSTLLRMIAGLEDITEGNIYIAGKRVNDLSPAERNIAMVFQDYALYPHMTVRDNLSFGLRMKKVPEEEIEKRITRAAKMLAIEEYMNRRPAQLSGGQRQRVAIGRAIVREPNLFLFDEPLSNLDAKLRGQTRIEIAALHQQLHSTSVYVTHDQVEAMTLATKIAVLNAGIVQQLGSPLELYNKPANVFVAGFIGSPSMNFFVGNLKIANGKKTFHISQNNKEYVLDATYMQTPKQDGKYVLGLRPESIKILLPEEKQAGEKADLIGEVLLTEVHGHETHLITEVGGVQCISRTANAKRLEKIAELHMGIQAELSIDKKSMHWFEYKDNIEEGARINELTE